MWHIFYVSPSVIYPFLFCALCMWKYISILKHKQTWLDAPLGSTCLNSEFSLFDELIWFFLSSVHNTRYIAEISHQERLFPELIIWLPELLLLYWSWITFARAIFLAWCGTVLIHLGISVSVHCHEHVVCMISVFRSCPSTGRQVTWGT